MSVRLSRRGFARVVGAGIAAAALPLRADADSTPPADPLPAPATPLPPAASSPTAPAQPPLVRLGSNENPYGPPAGAIAALLAMLPVACRYPDAQVEALEADVARLYGVTTEQVILGDGSSEILALAAFACTGPGRGLVMADPTFEAVARHADNGGAAVVRVPLTADYRHDLKAMLAAAAGAGLVYVCNPNNPTATVTPAGEVAAFLAAVPASATVLVDEAYHHYATGGGYDSVMGLVAQRPNLIVARTFSKIYGMAGLRCGYAVGQAAAIARLKRHQAWDNMNVAALLAAAAALDDPEHVEEARRRNAAVRQETCDALAARGLRVVPSQANFFMVDLGQPVKPVIAALRAQGVEVGRAFPALPTHLRVTVGKREEMSAFLAALARALPATA